MTSTIKFDIPSSVRSFALFSSLPSEIRYQIWEDAILEPGMHFLRLKTKAPATHLPAPLHQFAADDIEDDGAIPLPNFSKEKIPSKLWRASLQPRYPTPQANISNYVNLNRTLARLSATCSEAAAVVRRLINQSGGLKLKDGRVVFLGASEDVVCLEYLSTNDFRSSCRISLNIECPELSDIRHVAIPYCHAWDIETTVFRCSQCGNPHGRSLEKIYPAHLYEFLARCLPNLQTFYFIDYLIVKEDFVVEETKDDSNGSNPTSSSLSGEAKPKAEPAAETTLDKLNKKHHESDQGLLSDAAANPLPELTRGLNNTGDSTNPEAAGASRENKPEATTKRFKSDGRVFWEFDKSNWDVKSRVVDTLFWVRKRFVQYATRSKLSKHKHPEEVVFKILACEWVDKEVEASPTGRKAAHASKKQANKNPRPLPGKQACSATAVPATSGMTPSSSPLPSPLPSPLAASVSTSVPVPVPSGLDDKFTFIFGKRTECVFGFSAEFKP